MDLVEQIRAAYRRSGWTMQQLRDRSGLQLHPSTLARKIICDGRKGRGTLTPLWTKEAEALARALGVTLVVYPVPAA